MGHHATGTNDGVLANDQVRKNGGPGTDGCSALDHRRFDAPILLRLKLTVRGRRTRVGVINKGNAVTDEDIVFDGYTLAYEGVT